MDHLNNFINASILANKEILDLIESNSDENFHQSHSLGAGGDISIKIDLLAEEIFIKHLSQYGNINSEECGFIDNNSKYEIVIDPIDGSANFVSNLPYYGTSVALKYENKCIVGIITNLSNGEIFIKDESRFERGNLKDLVLKKVMKNQNSKLGIFERSYCSEHMASELRKNKIKYRSPGAFALSLAYTHDVDFLIFEGPMRIYDVEAGLYMCEDLYMYKTKKLLLISKDKEVFDKISQFI